MKRHKPTDDEILEVLSTSMSLRSNRQILLRNATLQSSTVNTSNTPISELAAQLELSRYDHPTEIDGDYGSTLHNVCYYSDFEPSAPILINCRLENVSFVQCRFYETEFCNLTLSDVAFLYIDLHNVGVSDLDLEGHLWKAAMVRNAFLVQKSTWNVRSARTTILEPRLPISSDRPKERTFISARRFESLTPKAAKSVLRYENCFKSSLQAVENSQPDLLVRLVDHKHTIAQIVQECVSQNDMFFEKYAYDASGSTHFCVRSLILTGNRSRA
jgi:hypothetical protein